MAFFVKNGAAAPLVLIGRRSYPVAVLQEAGNVAVCGLETGQVRVGFLLRQERALCLVPGICVSWEDGGYSY